MEGRGSDSEQPSRSQVMAMATSTFSPPPASRLSLKPQAGSKPYLLLSFPRFRAFHLLARATAGEAPVEAEAPAVPRFRDSRWMNGTWDLSRFEKGGAVDWGGVIDAEARRRKWLEDYPEATNTNEAVVFDTSIIPWWAWMKRFHLPEAEKLNGRAAMVGFFMAYFVDSLTGVGLVDQTGNFFCKTLLFVAVAGVLLIRKNEDIGSLKKLIDETTFYDKQWQATWQEESPAEPKN